ncbi:Fragile X mental retardation syndrome-related protein 2 [Durusdinium trenchii]|uniref:Fragile X mental retardation syndrome-related protein 2 n=1 Tax=Durusdinium trenchii TaxID=1381693 RepID=A0ABP0M6C1_9DINO
MGYGFLSKWFLQGCERLLDAVCLDVSAQVEYEVLPTDTTPAGWAVAQVVAVSGRFWQLRWPERWGERMGEVLMPLSRLRPCVSPKGNVENLLRKEEVVVDRELLAEDTSSCFRRVESLAVGLQAQETTELLRIRKVTLEPKILAIGTVKAVQRAKILIPSMLHNHRKANNLQEATKKREQALAMRSMKKLRDAWNPKEVPDSLVKDEFMMDSLHVGRLIGKGGSNIRALQNELDVKICIFDKDEKKKSIVVLGPDKDKVFEVRKNSQILRQRRKLDPEMKKWVTSRITLLEMIQKMCGLNSIHLEGQNISLTGTKEACEQGLKFLDAQLQYFMILKAWLGHSVVIVLPEMQPWASLELEKVKNGYAQRAQDDNQIVWPPIFVPGMGVQDAGSCMYLSPNLEGYGELLGKIDLQPWYPSLRELFVDRLHVTTSLSSHGCLEALRSLRGTASSEAKKLMKLVAGLLLQLYDMVRADPASHEVELSALRKDDAGSGSQWIESAVGAVVLDGT